MEVRVLTSGLLRQHEGRFRELMQQLEGVNIDEAFRQAWQSNQTLQQLKKGNFPEREHTHVFYGLFRRGRLIGAYRLFINRKGTMLWSKKEAGLMLKPLEPYVDSGRIVVHPNYRRSGFSNLLRAHALEQIRELRERIGSRFPRQYLIAPTGVHREKIATIYQSKGRREFIPSEELEAHGVWERLDEVRQTSQPVLAQAQKLGLRKVGYVKSSLGPAFVGDLDDVLAKTKNLVGDKPGEKVRRIAVVIGSFDPFTTGHERNIRTVLGESDIAQVLLMPAASYRSGRKILKTEPEDRLEMARLLVEAIRNPKLRLWEKDLRRINGQPIRRRPITWHLSRIAAEYPQKEIVLTVGSHALRGLFKELLHDRSWGALPIKISFYVAIRGGREEPAQLHSEAQQRFEQFMERLHRDQKERVTGLRFLDIEPLDISSTQVRDAIASGKNFQLSVPPVIVEYIKRRRLYGYVEATGAQ